MLLAAAATRLGVASCARFGNRIQAGGTLPQAVAGQAVRYWSIVRENPRPLRIHCLTVDLRDRRYETVALVGDDPDGAGPAEATLTKPESLAAGHDVVAAVNANAFASLPDSKGQQDTNWFAGKPVDIAGWVMHSGQQISPPQEQHASFWMDAAGRGHVGTLREPVPAREAVAGFGRLLTDGVNICTEDGVRHPRTALGLDAAGQQLWLVVVDGRQAGYSEGVSTRELAELMKELGCRDAINLDGGGSSVMLLALAGKSLQVVNRPSGGATRPIPVLLAIRERKP